MKSLLLAAALATPLPILACNRAPGEPAAFVTRDSAGVRLVISNRPHWGQDTGWKVDARPRIDVGAGPQDSAWFRRVTDAARLADGSILVAGAGTGDLRLFDSTGKLLRPLGGFGGGPGQFSSESSMMMWWGPAAELIISDFGNRRINRYDSLGIFQQSTPVATDPDLIGPDVAGVFNDGTWLVIGTSRLSAPPGTIIHGTLRCLRYRPDGTPIGVLLEIADGPRFVMDRDGDGQFPYLPLWPSPRYAPAVDRLIITTGARAEVEEFDLQGNLKRVSRWNVEPRSTSEVHQQYRTAALAAIEDPAERERYQRLLDLNLERPEFAPAYQRLLVDSRRNLWLERFRLPDEPTPVWDILDPDGRWLGSVATPPLLRIQRIGEDYILGVDQELTGTPRIRLHALNR